MKRRKQQKQPQTPPTRPLPELNDAGRAQLGADEDERRYRPRKDDASVEDPLGDWPEDR
jgi:hypothetical protein